MIFASALGGALVEETSLIARWLNQPGVRIVGSTTGFASPVHSAGRWLGWAAAARSARHAAAAMLESEIPGEPGPPVEESLRRAGIDRLGGAAQPVLPGRQPFGMTG